VQKNLSARETYSHLRSTEQILDELDSETKFIDDMVEFRMERERYLRTLRKDLKELREIELRKLDLMYHFIDWARDEVTELTKLVKGHSELDCVETSSEKN